MKLADLWCLWPVRLLVYVALVLSFSTPCARAAEGPATCLALNIYHEGDKRDGVFTEPLIGLFAIGLTTLERAKQDPAKVCDVVRAHKQFSWTISPPPVEINRAWRDAQDIAHFLLHPKFTDGATHFWAFYSKPYWRGDMEITGQWGNHILGRDRRKR